MYTVKDFSAALAGGAGIRAALAGAAWSRAALAGAARSRASFDGAEAENFRIGASSDSHKIPGLIFEFRFLYNVYNVPS